MMAMRKLSSQQIKTAAMLLLVSLLCQLTACSGYPAPGTSISSENITDKSNEATRVDFTLNVQNVNSQPLPLRNVQYRLTLNNQEVFTSLKAAQATIPQNGSITIIIPAIIPQNFIDKLHNLENVSYNLSGKLAYEAPGEIAAALFDTGIRVPSVKFSHSGSINLAQQ